MWEHVHAASPSDRVGVAILARSFAGVPADITWRLEQSTTPSRLVQLVAAIAHGVEVGVGWIIRRGLPGLTTTVAVGSAALGVGLIATLPAGDAATVAGRTAGGILFLLVGSFMLSGIQVFPSQPRVGAAMVAVPILILGLILWFTFVAPVIAVAVALSAGARARRLVRSRKGEVKAQAGDT